MTKKPSENLSDILYRFIILHERLAEKEQNLNTLLVKLNDSIDGFKNQLQNQLQEFNSFKHELSKEVSSQLRYASEDMREFVNERAMVFSAIANDIKPVIADFKRTVDKAEAELVPFVQNEKKTFKKTMINIVLITTVCVLVSLIIYKWVVPAPKLAIGEKEFETYFKGQLVQALPKSEQDRIFYSHKTKPTVMQEKKKKNEANEHNNENGENSENQEINSENNEMRY